MSEEMSGELREYSGVFFAKLLPSAKEELKKRTQSAAAAVDVADTYVEIEYAGRDSSRVVEQVLQDIAEVMVDAEGEVVCETEMPNGERRFEFYSISSGTLFRQTGTIVRGDVERVEKRT